MNNDRCQLYDLHRFYQIEEKQEQPTHDLESNCQHILRPPSLFLLDTSMLSVVLSIWKLRIQRDRRWAQQLYSWINTIALPPTICVLFLPFFVIEFFRLNPWNPFPTSLSLPIPETQSFNYCCILSEVSQQNDYQVAIYRQTVTIAVRARQEVWQ